MADAGITRRRLLITAAGITALATVWFAASELPPVARLWTAALVVVLPAMMMLQARELRAGMRVPRIAMYASTVLSLWLMALATGAVTIAAGFTLADLDLVPVPWRTAVLWAAGATLAGELLIILGWTAGLRGSDTLRDLLPVTRRERAIFLVVAITAGVCEEVVFR